jgi:hypothetical protein
MNPNVPMLDRSATHAWTVEAAARQVTTVGTDGRVMMTVDKA